MPFTFKLSQRLARMRVPALLLSTAVLAACEHPSRISGLGQGATLVVVPNAVTLAPLQSQQFAAFGRTNAGDSVPTAVTWNTNMGSITGSGLYTAGTPYGVYLVTAHQTGGSLSANALVTVAPAPVATVTVSPTSGSIVVGGAQQFSATLKDARGNVLTGRSVTWASSTATVATVDANGVARAVGIGVATITATSEGQSGTATLTVTVP
ncbi:MAG: hypothetical protein AUI99_02175 [Gemmatimonadetes bacterium 13_1_40CM_3_69_22]|nr:MAG: hypothetical protein AUI99_02175 [Gemmatimonadetes bacterium 13_1_40CM_3_69_22]PYO15420.1 MAG: hypothetical protein DMD31_06315 [Gemmatimonadota bacterium]